MVQSVCLTWSQETLTKRCAQDEDEQPAAGRRQLSKKKKEKKGKTGEGWVGAGVGLELQEKKENKETFHSHHQYTSSRFFSLGDVS